MVFTRLRNRVEIDTFFRFNHLKGVIHYDDACKLLCYRRERNDLKTFNTNLIKIIGNSAMGTFLKSTVGVLFGGNFSFENWGNTIQESYWNEDSVVNSVLSWVGALGAIYTLGTNDAKTLHNDKVLKIDGTSF